MNDTPQALASVTPFRPRAAVDLWSWRLPTVGLTMILLGASILLPQGVGFSLPGSIPNLDLPRLAMLATILLLAVATVASGRFAIRGAPRTMTLLAVLAAWQMVSAFASEARQGSLIWAVGNLLTTWGFAIAVISLAGGAERRERVARALLTIAIVLAAWAIFELVTQHKIVPVRNLWSGIEDQKFSTSLRRLIPGSRIQLPLMSIGPFAVSLTLASFLCALGGFLVVGSERTRRFPKLRVTLFVLAVLATQSRVGLLAASVMLLATVVWGGSRHERRWTLFVAIGAVGLALLLGGSQLRLALQTASRGAFARSTNSGSFGARLSNLPAMWEQFGEWWLVGFGPGSLFDADRVPTSVHLVTDPGSFFAFFLESGMPAGLMLTALVLASVVDGLRSRVIETRAAALGLIGFWVTTLSSITLWGWAVALILSGLIEGWSRGERRESARARRRSSAEGSTALGSIDV